MGKETAEQKLLRLIEQNDAPGSKPEAAPQPTPEAQEILSAVQGVGGTMAVPPALMNVVQTLKNMIPGLGMSREGFSIRELNKILMIAVAGMILFFASSIMSGIKEANTVVEFDQPKNIAFSAEKLLPMIPDVKRYVSAISFRNIFHPYDKQAVEAAAEEEAPSLPKQLAQKSEQLKLVGISWLDTAESASAMVENIESGITYFLRSGEKVNGLTVKTIYADSIILEFNGERMEMKL